MIFYEFSIDLFWFCWACLVGILFGLFVWWVLMSRVSAVCTYANNEFLWIWRCNYDHPYLVESNPKLSLPINSLEFDCPWHPLFYIALFFSLYFRHSRMFYEIRRLSGYHASEYLFILFFIFFIAWEGFNLASIVLLTS